MGLLIKGLLGALVVVLIGVLAKTKNYAIAGLVPLFPHLCAHRPLYCRQRAGDRSPARDHRIRHVVDSSLFYLSAVTVVFHRDYAPAVGAGRRSGMLGAVRLAVNPRLEPFPLAQRAAAVDSE
ncbi:inner membrane protein [Klebsiella pneumoniae]|nr:inner membrane protein [Klebsiella pneumoniae]